MAVPVTQEQILQELQSMQQAMSILKQNNDLLQQQLQQKVSIQQSSESFSNVHFSAQMAKPDKFSGGIHNSAPRAWLTQITTYLDYCGVRDFQRVAVASSYLTEAALNWFSTLSSEQKSSWSLFVQQFQSHFVPVDSAHQARATLDTIRMRDNINIYNNLFNQCIIRIPDMHAKDQIHRYLQGLPIDLQRDLVTKEFGSLHEAMNTATRISSLRATLKPRTPFVSHPQTVHRSINPSTNIPPRIASSVPMDLSYLQEQSELEENVPEQKYENGTEEQQQLHVMKRNWPKKLSEEERRKCFAEGRCLRCRQTGHIGKNCPMFPSSHPKKF